MPRVPNQVLQEPWDNHGAKVTVIHTLPRLPVGRRFRAASGVRRVYRRFGATSCDGPAQDVSREIFPKTPLPRSVGGAGELRPALLVVRGHERA